MWKGYLGIIKDATESHVRVELHTTNRVVTVPKDDVSIAGGSDSRGASFSSGFGSRNAGFDARGSQTPAYAGLGAATPNPYSDTRGSRTPAWDAGSKTPAYDAGSRTPAWDAGSKTPAYDVGGGTPAWGSTARTPGAADYSNPFTPGGMPYQNALDDNVPDHAPTPAPVTPYHPQTPAGYPSTPGMPPQTPGMGIPATPAANVAVLGIQYITIEASSEWITVQIQVSIKSLPSRIFKDGSLDGQQGSIRQIDPSRRSCIVRLENGEQVSMAPEFLSPVPPEKRQPFKVISGPDREKIGSLLSIDGQEGVVRFDRESQIVMMNLSAMARYVEN